MYNYPLHLQDVVIRHEVILYHLILMAYVGNDVSGFSGCAAGRIQTGVKSN